MCHLRLVFISANVKQKMFCSKFFERNRFFLLDFSEKKSIDVNGRPLRTGITATDRDEIHLSGKADGIVIVITGGKSFKIRY